MNTCATFFSKFEFGTIVVSIETKVFGAHKLLLVQLERKKTVKGRRVMKVV